MGNTTRYQIWHVERQQEGIGYRWAIWDENLNQVVKSGLSLSADEAVKQATFWITFLMDFAREESKAKK
jgi:hypothetical protein